MDDGQEYSLKKLPELAKALGMVVKVITLYNPEQDGKSECSICMIIEKTRIVIIDMDIP